MVFISLKKPFSRHSKKSSNMSTRSGTLVKESLPMVSVKTKVDFDSSGMETELLRAPIWKTAKSYRLDFGEHDPFVPLRCLGE